LVGYVFIIQCHVIFLYLLHDKNGAN